MVLGYYVTRLTHLGQYQFTDFLLMHFVFGLVKISVTLFYKRIFITPRFRCWANATLIAVSMWMISAFFVRIMEQIVLLKLIPAGFSTLCARGLKLLDHTAIAIIKRIHN